MIGKQILNYEIKSLLGEGGMGNVYLAEHVQLGRKVAIKALHAQLVNNQSIRTRFKNEASTMAHLQHPNIVALYDYLEAPDGLFLIMEYVEGTPLDEYIRSVSGPIPPERAVPMFTQILEGFKYAHGMGVVHRDIKPSNILIAKDGSMKILDFGIAKLVNEAGNKLTKTGTQMGTVFYMSPEQVQGKDVDHRSDIYALGVTFFQMLTGICPYDGLTTEFEVYSKIVNEPLPSPGSMIPGIAAHLNTAVAVSTHKDPAYRYSGCGDFIAAINGQASSYAPPVIPMQHTKVASGHTSANSGANNLAGATSVSGNSKKKRSWLKISLISAGVLLLVAGAWIFWKISGTDAHLRFIPKNAFTVATIDLKSLAGKTDFETIQSLSIYQEMMKEMDRENSTISESVEKPTKTGIDIFSKPYAFLASDRGDENSIYAGLVFAISDAEDFRTFAEDMSKGGMTDEESDMFYITIDNNEAALAWNSSGAVLLLANKSDDELKKQCRRLLNQEKEESILSVSSFDEFLDAQHDLSVYTNGASAAKNSSVSSLSMLSKEALIYGLDFLEAQVSLTVTGITDEDGTDVSVFNASGISADLSKSIPESKVNIATSLNFPALYDYMERDNNLSMILDNISREMGIERVALRELLSGDAFAALVNFEQRVETRMEKVAHANYDWWFGSYYTYSYETYYDTNIVPVFVIGMTVKNQDVMSTVINNNFSYNDTIGVPSLESGTFSTFAVSNSSNYFFTNDYQMALSLSNNGNAGTSLNANSMSSVSAKSLAGNAELQLSSYPEFLNVSLRDEIGERSYNSFTSFWSVMNTVNLSKDANKVTLTLNLAASGNSLMILLNAADAAYQAEKNY
jgi:serine/threonine protein kinase